MSAGDSQPVDFPRYNYQRRGRGGRYDRAIGAVLISLLTAAIIACVSNLFSVNGAVANLERTAAVLAKSQEFQQLQISQLQGELNEMRGKVYRSDGSIAGDFGADERKP